MNKHSILKIGCVLIITVSSLFFNLAQARVLTIDNYTQSQDVLDRGDTTNDTRNAQNGIAGSDLENIDRLLIAESAFGKRGYKTKLEVTEGLLNISNNDSSAVLASILWNFEPIDFTGYGDTLVFEIKKLNLGVNVEFIVNGISSSGVKSFTELGDVEFSFSDFLQPNLFKTVNSLRMDFTGPSSWDGSFGPLSVVNRSPQVGSVPLPSSLVLMASALVGLITISRSRNANQT